MSISAAPRVMVVDGSKLVRKLIGDVLQRELHGCRGDRRAAASREAREALAAGAGRPGHHRRWRCPTATAWRWRAACARPPARPTCRSSWSPATRRSTWKSRRFTEDVTDYFDKSLGHSALAAFIRGYVQPQPIPGARVLYVEDSTVVALATKRMLERHGLRCCTCVSVEDALAHLEQHRGAGTTSGADLVLTDVYLKGELAAATCCDRIRNDFGYGKRRLPVLVMTGDDNPDNQTDLLRAGANDLVLKPIEERLLVTKPLFQLRAVRQLRAEPRSRP